MLKLGLSPDSEIFGALVRKLADLDRLQEAMSLLDEAALFGLRLRERLNILSTLLSLTSHTSIVNCERNIRELRRRLEAADMKLHPMIGPDPEKWRIAAAEARNSKKSQNDRVIRRVRSAMSGH